MMKFNELIENANKISLDKIEKNIFSLGGRGHYENPISNLLSFFINPNEEHGLSTLFLKSFLEVAKISSCNVKTVSVPKREVYTEDSKKIDIIIEFENDVIVIENKIKHYINNPFLSYENHINKNYRNKRKYFFILSPRKEISPNGWVSLTYKDLISKIYKNIGHDIFDIKHSKWIVLLREFLLNIENECGCEKMEENIFNFVGENYSAIYEVNKMVKEYITEVKRQGCEAIRLASDDVNRNIFDKEHDWGGDGKAIRLLDQYWGGKTNITLLLVPDGTFRIQLYVYNIANENLAELNEYINNAKFNEFWTEQKSIRCFGFINCKDIKNALLEVKEVAVLLNNYFSNKSIVNNLN